MNNGYVKIFRSITEKGYYKKSQYIHLWVHLLLKANHKSKEFMWNKNIILIKEGQFLTGRKELSKDTGIPETTIERILEMLENEHQIEQQKTNLYRIITIINWKQYQSSDTKTDNKRTTNGQQTDTNNNDNNNKNEKKKNLEDFPNLLSINGFKEKWLEWVKERKEQRKPLKESTIERQLTMLNKQPNPIEVIQKSLDNQYQGLFPLKQEIKKQHQTDYSNVGNKV